MTVGVLRIAVLRMAVWVSRISERGPLNANAKKCCIYKNTEDIYMENNAWLLEHMEFRFHC